jgi:L-malate glycosyltransferase
VRRSLGWTSPDQKEHLVRIFFLSRSYSSHDARFLRAVIDAGHKAWFCSLSGLATTTVEPVAGATYVDPPRGRRGNGGGNDIAMLVPSFRGILDQVRPDILHAGPVQDCGLLAALSGFNPFVLMSWGFDLLLDADASAKSKDDTRRALAAADAFVCDSAVVEHAASRFSLSRDSTIVRFPWGVDLEMFSPARRGPTDVVKLLSTRKWEPMYGIETLVDAFSQAVRRDGRLRLTMLGGGSFADRVQQRVHDLDLSAIVEMPGFISQRDIPRYFQEAFAYVCCTPSDGSSISLLESFASGLPVVVADSPGNREWVSEGQHGWLVSPQEPGRYAEALLACSSLTESEYLDMSRRNRDLAIDRADWSKNVLPLLRLYDRIGRGLSKPGSEL